LNRDKADFFDTKTGTNEALYQRVLGRRFVHDSEVIGALEEHRTTSVIENLRQIKYPRSCTHEAVLFRHGFLPVLAFPFERSAQPFMRQGT
jgi:hypothetical protein